MFQREMFSNMIRNAQWMGAGCMAVVHAVDDEWVHKYAPSRDGTCNYLEWCIAETAAGRKLSAMPEIDFLVHTAQVYIVVMRRYTAWGYAHSPLTDNVLATASAYRAYMDTTFGRDYYADDIHCGNVMRRADGSAVLTDPCVSAYKSSPIVDKFVLQ